MGEPSTSSGAEGTPAETHARWLPASFSRDWPRPASIFRMSSRSMGRRSTPLQTRQGHTLRMRFHTHTSQDPLCSSKTICRLCT